MSHLVLLFVFVLFDDFVLCDILSNKELLRLFGGFILHFDCAMLHSTRRMSRDGNRFCVRILADVCPKEIKLLL